MKYVSTCLCRGICVCTCVMYGTGKAHTDVWSQSSSSVNSVFVNLPTHALKLTCNLRINPCCACSVICRNAQSGKKKSESCCQLGLNKALPSCFSPYCCPFPGLRTAMFPTVLFFLLVISLFKMAPRTAQKPCL